MAGLGKIVQTDEPKMAKALAIRAEVKLVIE